MKKAWRCFRSGLNLRPECNDFSCVFDRHTWFENFAVNMGRALYRQIRVFRCIGCAFGRRNRGGDYLL